MELEGLLVSVLERCLSHDAFTVKQKRMLTLWRQQAPSIMPSRRNSSGSHYPYPHFHSHHRQVTLNLFVVMYLILMSFMQEQQQSKLGEHFKALSSFLSTRAKLRESTGFWVEYRRTWKFSACHVHGQATKSSGFNSRRNDNLFMTLTPCFASCTS